MAINMKSYRPYWLGAVSMAALSLCAVAVPLSSAKAFIGADIGSVGISLDGPVYGYGYFPYVPPIGTGRPTITVVHYFIS